VKGCDAGPTSAHLNGDRTQKIALTDVNAAMAQDRVSGCDVEIEVREQTGLGWIAAFDPLLTLPS
jgi:hypothetical protein